MTRRRPVTRAEIHFGSDGRILTLPVDAVVRGVDGYGATPIHALFVPLLRALNRAAVRHWQRLAEARAKAGIKAPRPERIACPRPCPWPCTCRQCEREFFRVWRVSVRYCSDACAATARQKGIAKYVTRVVAAKAARRAANRADRTCARCGEALTAQRSTMRFCSAGCRVAAHRAAADGAPASA